MKFEHSLYQKPLSMTGFGGGATSLSNAGGSSVPLEYYYTHRVVGFTDGAYSSFTNNYGTPKSGRATNSNFYYTNGWNHGIGNTDGLVFYVEAVNSSSIYLDHTSSSAGHSTSQGSNWGSGLLFNTRVYIWNLGNSASNAADGSSLIKQHNFAATVTQYNVNNNAFDFQPTGSLVGGIVDTPLLQAGNYYAVGVDYRDRTTNASETINSGSYLNSFTQKTSSSVVWQDGTHAVNIHYHSTPSYSGYSDNGTSSSYGQMSWWKWRRAE